MIFLLGRFDDYAAAVEMNRSSAQRLTHRKLRSILHLDSRAVAQAKNRVRIFGSANRVSAPDFRARRQRPRLFIGDDVDWSFRSLHRRFKRSDWQITLNQGPGNYAQTNY